MALINTNLTQDSQRLIDEYSLFEQISNENCNLIFIGCKIFVLTRYYCLQSIQDIIIQFLALTLAIKFNIFRKLSSVFKLGY